MAVNLLLGINMQAIAEAISLREHLRIDRDVLLQVLSKTTEIASLMAGKFQKIKERDHSPEFQLPLMSHDIILVIDAARNAGADLPTVSIAQSILASNVSSRSDLNLFRSHSFCYRSRVEGRGSRFSVSGLRHRTEAAVSDQGRASTVGSWETALKPMVCFASNRLKRILNRMGVGSVREDNVDLGLTDKVVLATGSTAGIGFAIARSIAIEGAHVYVNGRTQKRVDWAVAAIRSEAKTIKVDGIAADFSSSAGAEAVIAKLPVVDVLINNVGIFEPKPFAEIPDADWYRFFEINVMSGVRLARHYLAGMLRKNWGRILFISSESAVQIPPEMLHYGMTKTAQVALARGIAESVAGTGVTVNSILPGPTESEGVGGFVEAMAKQQNKSKQAIEKEFFEHVRPSSLLRRFARVDEVAAMATFVAGELSSATNGAALRVDGGVVRAIL